VLYYPPIIPTSLPAGTAPPHPTRLAVKRLFARKDVRGGLFDKQEGGGWGLRPSPPYAVAPTVTHLASSSCQHPRPPVTISLLPTKGKHGNRLSTTDQCKATTSMGAQQGWDAQRRAGRRAEQLGAGVEHCGSGRRRNKQQDGRGDYRRVIEFVVVPLIQKSPLCFEPIQNT